MAVTLETLQDRLLEINEKSLDIVNSAEAEERELTDDEIEVLEDLKKEYKHTEKRIDTMEGVFNQVDSLKLKVGRKTDPNDMIAEPQKRPALSAQVDSYASRGNWGFRNMGEFANSVRTAKISGVDPRLIKNAPTTYGTEGIAADGGFAVPPDFRDAIMEKVQGEDSLLSRTDQMNTGSNTLTIPKDETTPWQTSGGILAYWESEGAQLTESKPLLESITLKTNKLTALIPVTEELLEDAPSLDGYLRRKVPMKFDLKIQTALIKGEGTGDPLGIKNSNCLVSVAKDSGQSADTLSFGNIVGMWSRMYAPCRSRAVWHINQDVEPQLLQMAFEGTSSSVPAYMPANGLSGAPYATLMGRPVIPIQSCETLGDKGDIYLCDWSQYLTVIKGGVRSDVSMHLYFDYDMTAFRFILRMTGQPWWNTSITPLHGTTNTLGCFITLDERA